MHLIYNLVPRQADVRIASMPVGILAVFGDLRIQLRQRAGFIPALHASIVKVCRQLYYNYGLSATAAGTSRRMLGDIVEESTILLI
jgi:hypothetical protein